MVSPVEKNGGRSTRPGTLAGGGTIQAAAAGGSVTYGSASSFAGGAQGATAASQYVSTRTSSGWATQNITAPAFSGSYHEPGEGTPYRVFSAELARGILWNGDRCRGEGSECAVANPPLEGTDAPAGYQDYYLREGGAFTALLGDANSGFLRLDPARFELRLAGSSPDLRHPVLSSCASLTADATEVPEGEGCDPEAQNLYLYSPGAGLSLLNLAPGETTGTPGAELAAPSGAVSESGGRVYFTLAGDLYLRSGSQTAQVDADAGGEGAFQTASADGSVAFFAKGEHLWRWLASSGHATDLTPGGGVKGVLGASTSGSIVYFQDEAALKRWSSGATVTVASGGEAAQAGDFLPGTAPQAEGTARVSADGTKLLFVSTAPLTRSEGGVYDNTDLNTGEPDSQVYLYDEGTARLACLSCNPSNERPLGASTIPGVPRNGTGPGATVAYAPRALSADGRRAFFQSSDALVLTDTDAAPDAYEWEAQGEGGCGRPGGCVALISSGRSAGGGLFVDASADGADAYFITDASLVEGDLGSGDLYDARIGGGFPVTPKPIPCTGDACQVLPPEPVDPTLTTLLPGLGNPPVRYPGRKRCPKGKRKVKRKGKVRCVKRHRRHRKHKRHGKRGRAHGAKRQGRRSGR